MKRITKPDQSKLHTKSLSEQSKSGSETGIPKHVLEAIVDTMLPDIIAFFETEEGKREFEEWKKMQASHHTAEPASSSQENLS